MTNVAAFVLRGCWRLLLASVLVAACGGNGTEASEFDSQFLNSSRDAIRSNLATADVVFVGTIIAVGSPPPAWSGEYAMTQRVTYDVERTIKGTITGSVAEIEHLVVAGSRTADPSAVGLAPAVFKAGEKKIVFALSQGGVIRDFDERVGTMPHSAMNEQAVESLLS